MEPENQEGLLPFLREFKRRYPKKDIWLFTGNLYEELTAGVGEHPKSLDITPEILSYVDILVDGRFVEELKRHGIRATVLADGGSPQEIAALPKPAAIMAAWDYKAIEIMGYARKAGFAIPEQIAVIGVDADPIVCSFTNPPLTSVEPGFERMGYAGAAALDAMMCGRKLNSAIRIPCLPKGVIERASTSFLPTGRALVDRATTIIAQEAANGLSVGALSARLKVSPQLLALRFRQFKQTAPRELILRTRLEKAKKLLKDPAMKTESVASQCGFSSKNRLFHVFKERFGMTVGEFRRSTWKHGSSKGAMRVH